MYDEVGRVMAENASSIDERIKRWETSLVRAMRVTTNAKKTFRIPSTLMIRTTVSTAGKDRAIFPLWYRGCPVGEVTVEGRTRTLTVLENAARCIEEEAHVGTHDWRSPAANAFRSGFKKLGNNCKTIMGTPERVIETQLITLMTERPKMQLKRVRPVLVAGCALQMPSIVGASSGTPKIAQGNAGGHVDILARSVAERPGHLAVWEVKKKGTLADAVPQAYIYAAALLHLLRSRRGLRWYRLFGFDGILPKKHLAVDAVVAVDQGQKVNVRQQLTEWCSRMPQVVGDNQDLIRPYGAFYEVADSGIRIDDPVSLSQSARLDKS